MNVLLLKCIKFLFIKCNIQYVLLTFRCMWSRNGQSSLTIRQWWHWKPICHLNEWLYNLQISCCADNEIHL